MPKLRKGGVGFYVIISEAHLTKLKELIAAKAKAQGKSVHGALSAEVEVAIEDYIEKHTSLTPHVEVRMNPGFPLDKAVCLQILQALGRKGIEYEFVQRDLEDAVAQLRGSDKRTVKHWTERLLHYEFVSVRYPGLTEEDAEGKTLMNPKWARRLQKTPIFKVLYHPK